MNNAYPERNEVKPKDIVALAGDPSASLGISVL